MSSTVRASYRNLHARKARVALRQKPRLSMGLASVVLASLWKLWRHQRLAKKRHKSDFVRLSDDLQQIRRVLDNFTADQRFVMSQLEAAVQSKTRLDEVASRAKSQKAISSRLDRMEEDMQTKARDYAHSRLTEHNGDPFLYESQPLLAEGPTSGSLPHALTFDLRKGSQTFDALSSSQSLEPYQQQSHQMNWDLLDLGIQDQTSVPYERFGEDARLLSEPQPIPVSTTDVSDLLSLPVPPSTPALAVPKTPNSIMSSAPGDLNILGQQVDDGPATNEAHSSTPAHDQAGPRPPQIQSVHLQRRRSLVTKQALRHNLLCAQEQSRDVYNCNALEALSRAGEQLRKTEQLLSEAEETDAAVLQIQHTLEPAAEKPASLKRAEYRAAKSKSACESAYSRLCMAIDSAERQASSPQSDSLTQQQPITRLGSGPSSLAPRPELGQANEQTPSRPSRLGLRNGVVIHSQRAQQHGAPPNPHRHHRSSSSIPSPSPLTSAVEQKGVGHERSPAGSSMPGPSPSGRLDKHKRSHSENFDGGERSGMPTADPLGNKSSFGTFKEAEAALEAKNLALINELELRRLALHRN